MDIRVATGFETGPAAGLTTGNNGNRVFDIFTAGASITAGSKRTGTYGLEIAASASSPAAGWDTNTLFSVNRCVASGWVRFPTALPTNSVIIAQIDMATGPNLELRFNTTTDKLAISIAGGSVIDGPSVVADTWYHVEIYADTSANPFTLDWWVDGVAQTSTSAASAAENLTSFHLGCNSTAQTYTCHYDDWVVWTDTAEITGLPFGAHKVLGLMVDPAGTVTLSGTTANFSTFAGATPTLTAWNATTARNNIDEMPPNVGSAQDGFCQTANATTNYVQVPLTSYTIAGGETVAGARLLACCWAASTSVGTIGFRSYNGTTERTLFAAADVNADNTATPVWLCRLLTQADIDTQTELDALEIRVGFSGDAAPDQGVHALMVELAVAEAVDTGATASPAALSASATIPKPTVAATGLPSALAAAATLPAAVANIVAAPAVLAAVGTLPKPAIPATVLPVALAVPASLPTPIAAEFTSVTPTALAVPASLPQAVASVGAAPAALSTAATLPQPAINVTTAPSALAAATNLPQVAVSTAAAPLVLTASATLPQPGIGVTAVPATLDALASLPSPAITIVAGPAALAVLAALAKPDLHVAAVPAALAALVSLPTPTIPGGGDAFMTPAALAVVVALPRPAIDTRAFPGVLNATVSLPTPTQHIGAGPAALAVTASLPQPAVHVGLVVAVVSVLATLPTPIIVVQAPYEPIYVSLDSVGSADGLDSLGSAGVLDHSGGLISGMLG